MSDEITRVREQLAMLQRRLDELELELERDRDGDGVERRGDRRTVLKLAAGAAVGGIAAVAAATPASADDPNDITLGQTKSTTGGVTHAHNNGITSHEMAFVFQSGSPGFSPMVSLAPAALGGWSRDNQRHPTGIFGFTNRSDGHGVVGMAKPSTDAPPYLGGGHGVVGFSNASGGAGVLGIRDDDGDGVRGKAGQLGIGVSGESTNGIGVEGVSVGSAGTGGKFSGARAQLRLAGIGGLGPRHPLDNPVDHSTGEVVFVTDGGDLDNLWVCIASGNPGTWRKLAGPATAGAFHPIVPTRAYDSRFDSYAVHGPMQPNEQRVVSVADGHDIDGVAVSPDVVPEHATAITYNATITDTTGIGFLSVAPGDVVEITSSALNWSAAGLTMANAGVVKLDDQRRITVTNGPAGSTHVVVDLTGYYL